jgi:3-phenylpropionate/trans-cinnamate dioxygenase ferredoxin reductase component
MSDSLRKIVIVGGGFAAISAAETLRETGYDGRILMLSEETDLPYDRPPLSKAYLSGEQSLNDILFQKQAWFEERRIDIELNQRVAMLDVAARTLTTASGARHDYDRLLLVTGARPRPIHGPFEQAGVALHYLRTRFDADRMRALAVPGSRVVLVGGGVIGMEAAATLSSMGCKVTVLEAAERVMARFFPTEMSDLLREIHCQRGIDVRTNVVVERVQRTDAGGALIRLQDGTTIDADWLLVGVGVIPNGELAENAGLPIRLQGIEVNAQARTAAADIYAAGDVAAFEIGGVWTRWENWTHARHQAQVAAKAMLGQDVSYWDVPWVWSHQFEFNIQVTGAPHGDAIVRRGDLANGKLTVFHLKNSRVVGATTINDSKHKSSIRKLVAARAEIAGEVLADTGADLKKLAASL